MWAYCERVSQELRDRGWTLDDAIRIAEFQIPTTKENVKATFFDTIISVMYPEKTSSKLDAKEFSEVVEVVQMTLANMGISLPFALEEQ